MEISGGMFIIKTISVKNPKHIWEGTLKGYTYGILEGIPKTIACRISKQIPNDFQNAMPEKNLEKLLKFSRIN